MSGSKGLALAAVAALGVSMAVGYVVHKVNEEEEQQKQFQRAPGPPRSITFSAVEVENHWRRIFEEYATSGTFRRSSRNKELLRSRGLPVASRPHLWPILSGAADRRAKNPGYYREMLEMNKLQPNSSAEDIEKDLHRTFPDEPYLNTKSGIDSLRNVLIAFSWAHPEIGYCQAMNFVCAALLIAGCSEDDTFWLLDTMVTDLLPSRFYSHSLDGLKKELAILNKIVEQELPELCRHFNRLNLHLDLFSIRWFMCLFVNSFPLKLAMRFLDCFFYEGRKALFRVSVALLKLHERRLLATHDMTDAFVLCRDLPASPYLLTFEDLFQPHLDLGEITSSRIAKIEAVVEQQLQATASASASKPAPAPISTPTNLTDIENASSDVDDGHSSSLVQTNPTLDAVSDSQVESTTVTPVNEEETN